MNELLSRLQQLEDSYYGDKEAARQKQFFDTYGGRFSNNRGLGLAILNELDAQGIDTSAADEAVTQILDQLRTECNEIIESIKGVQQDAIQNAQKVEAIQNVVSDAVARNTNATTAPGAEDISSEGDASIEGDDYIDAMNPADQETADLPEDFVPSDVADEAMGGGEEPMPEDDAGGEEPMPEDDAGGEEPMPSTEVESDRRMKRVKSLRSNYNSLKNSWKPSAGILHAVSGGRI